MQLKPAIKVTLAFLLGLSVLALVATVVKTYQLKNISVRMDFTTNIVGLYIWTSVEFAVVIIAASIPTLKPLFRGRMFNKSSSKGNAYKLSHTPNKPSRNQSYKSAGWDFGTFDTVARHQGDSSSEQNILPADNYTDLCAQDIRKTTVITVDRENGSMGSAGESRKFGSRQESREPSVEPPRLWAEGHEV
ncbi:MAG: hypothetical protein M1820_006652 [Bogoriella megaspora]|nr:MAG: hypothetical protein M1820_006652 [Bogoriella megaspora]